MNEEFEKSLRHRKRPLSRFHAEELILDYVENRLDSERREAMEEHLQQSRSAQQSLTAVRAADQYVARLAQIEVSPLIIQRVQDTKLGWAKWTERLAWRNWPEIARWSTEAVVIAAVFATLISFLPLHKLARLMPASTQEVVLAEREKVNDQIEEDTPEAQPQPQQAVARTTPPNVPPTAPAPLVAGAAPVAASTPAKTIVPESQAVALNLPTSKKPEVTAGDENEDIQDGAKGPRGFVYRAFMATTSLDETTVSVRDLIVSLGGEKAGQVELGWRKSTGTYFHFSLPESNYESLLSELRAHGPVRIYKDPHWRVMPEGQIRLILLVEDQSLKN